ncbi:hypothetical protein Mal65_52540 [Crateriforma conspicua]|nr:hypothetical protein Mal65_52540 [Crateriforma conspicua]
MAYRCEVDSAEGMVQLIATNYLRHGYFWYVTGRIPVGKDPLKTDKKLIEKYGIDVSPWERTRRRKAGLANVQYARFKDWFILLVTEGHHQIRQPEDRGGEKNQLRDCRRVPIKFAGYSISYRRSGVTEKGKPLKWHAHVRIDRPTYKQLKAHFAGVACHRSPENLGEELGKLPFARYAPVRRQLLNLLRTANKKRQSQGYQPVPVEALRLRRGQVKIYRDPS